MFPSDGEKGECFRSAKVLRAAVAESRVFVAAPVATGGVVLSAAIADALLFVGNKESFQLFNPRHR